MYVYLVLLVAVVLYRFGSLFPESLTIFRILSTVRLCRFESSLGEIRSSVTSLTICFLSASVTFGRGGHWRPPTGIEFWLLCCDAFEGPGQVKNSKFSFKVLFHYLRNWSLWSNDQEVRYLLDTSTKSMAHGPVDILLFISIALGSFDT